MANVKVFADKQTNGQAKNSLNLIFQYGGIKMNAPSYVIAHDFCKEITTSMFQIWFYALFFQI
jgi:hypothetical protein